MPNRKFSRRDSSKLSVFGAAGAVLLAACAPAAAPSATSAPAKAPEATKAPEAATRPRRRSRPPLPRQERGEASVGTVVPGGPHPYFKPMQPAIEDAKKDFKLSKVIFKSPQEWALNAQNQVIDSWWRRGTTRS